MYYHRAMAFFSELATNASAKNVAILLYSGNVRGPLFTY